MPIGFFDSGVGGLSVLRDAIKIMPNENYIYFGDSKNAPYGVKELEDVKTLTYKAVEFLIAKGAKALVIACNTATSAAVASLRKDYNDIPIVGIEPAIKPAVALNRQGKVVIMATPMTLNLKKFNNLLKKYKDKAEIIPMPCNGLVEFVESGNLSGEDIKEYLRGKFSPHMDKKIGAIVLGCTHYPFIKNTLSSVIGKDIPIIDGGIGTSREIKRRLEIANLNTLSQTKGLVKIYNSLECDKIMETSYRLLEI